MELRQPFKNMLLFFRIAGFTSRKLSVAHRLAATFFFLFFGVFTWILIALAILQTNGYNDLMMYFLFAPTICGLLLKATKIFSNFEPIEELFKFSDVIFDVSDFRPYYDRAIRRALLLSNIQLTGYMLLWVLGTIASCLRKNLAIPMFMIGNKDNLFWSYWTCQSLIGGAYVTYLFAAINLLPICMLLVIHEYSVYMNDVVRKFNSFTEVRRFMQIQSEFKM